MNIFFTADTHFGHKNIIKYCNRPFRCVKEMDDTIIKNWNNVVGEKDEVYHIGDFAWRNTEKYISALNGKIILIAGNHDKDARRCSHLFHRHISTMHEMTYNKTKIVLCHYAMRVWNKSHFNSWHLYGHSHGGLESFGKSYDVGVDNNDFKPVSIEEVAVIMSGLPNNFNLVKERG